MPILPQVGSKSWLHRIVVAFIYLVLITGGLTMVYPFLLMVSGSMTNYADQNRLVLVPRYWKNKDDQFTKYLADKYHLATGADVVSLYYTGNTRSRLEVVYDDKQFIAHGVPEAADIEKNPRKFQPVVDDWHAFTRTVPADKLAYLFEAQVEDMQIYYLREKYLALARQKYASLHLSDIQMERAALKLLNSIHGLGYQNFFEIKVLKQQYFLADWFPETTTPRYQDWAYFITEKVRKEHPQYVMPILGRQVWHSYLTEKFGTADIFNKLHGTTYKQLYEIPFPPSTLAVQPGVARAWDKFVSDYWPLRFTSIDMLFPAQINSDWHAFLRETAQPDPVDFQRRYGIPPTHGLAMSFPPTARELMRQFPQAKHTEVNEEANYKPLRTMWAKFMHGNVPNSAKTLLVPELQYARFLQQKYGSLDNLPAGYLKTVQVDGKAVAVTDFKQLEPPMRVVDYYEWSQHRESIFRGFLLNNYANVIAFIATKGHALTNTLVLVLATLLTTLVINPIAAYALSRYKLKQTQQILLFLIATMAFPAEISMIPAFLLMRDLHLLNTYWALLIPGLANGFSIFLLKGFFDSLPQELFEAAQLDGAGEYTTFTQVCVPLVTPILAVTALGTFTATYSGWSWAMLACQKQEMWTLMVWLMQKQLGWFPPPSLIMASLVIASLPTLLVFILAQNVIMKGIILPEMK
ncbi:MAG: carbohydrate ABC transporter permease [Armatimonadota bacterium]